ncbi:ATP-binding protein [Sorangium sp. So ce693]|uniref:ATP-binding protein n=1 Tax=Sorangium sp. So ce693 TaxID=3133318 RepID=UPI003F61AF39
MPGGACMEDFSCEAGRGVDRSFARSLGPCQWVRAKQNVIVLGATGAGKSFLGGALAQAACRQGFRALVIRTPRLLQQPAVRVPTGPTRTPSRAWPRSPCGSSTTFCSRR